MESLRLKRWSRLRRYSRNLKATRRLLEKYDGEVFTADAGALAAEIGRAGDSGLKAFWLGLMDAKYKAAMRRVP